MVFSSLPITRGAGSAKRLLGEPLAALRRFRSDGAVVVLQHGWPGTRDSRQHVTALVTDGVAVVLPGLRGSGEPGKRVPGIAGVCNAAAQARSVAGLIAGLGAATAPLAPRWRPHEASAELLNAVLPG